MLKRFLKFIDLLIEEYEKDPNAPKEIKELSKMLTSTLDGKKLTSSIKKLPVSLVILTELSREVYNSLSNIEGVEGMGDAVKYIVTHPLPTDVQKYIVNRAFFSF